MFRRTSVVKEIVFFLFCLLLSVICIAAFAGTMEQPVSASATINASSSASNAELRGTNATNPFAKLPLKRDSTQSNSNGSSFTIWVTLVIGLLVAFGYILVQRQKKDGVRSRLSDPKTWLGLLKQSPEKSNLKINKQLTLTSRASLHVVTWHGEELLIACADQTVSILARHAFDVNDTDENMVQENSDVELNSKEKI